MAGFLDWELESGSEFNDRNNKVYETNIENGVNKDTSAVKLGIWLHKKYGTKLSKKDLEREIFENRKYLSRYLRKDLIEKKHTVQKGDTLLEIARENDIRPEEIILKNPGVGSAMTLREGVKLVLPAPDEIKHGIASEIRSLMTSKTYLFQKTGAAHEQALKTATEFYEARQKNTELTRRIAETINQKRDETPTKTAFYIWKTAGDKNVRERHEDREGKIFSWDNPPQGGHPGEDYNCRCRAIPYLLPPEY